MTYTKPEVKVLGSVAEITRTGMTNITNVDIKGGSRPSNGR
jgi:hypothetical protein